MIHWMLTRMEENPNSVFYGRELQTKFPEAFAEALKDRMLRRLPASSYPSYHSPFGSSLLVLENSGRLEGIAEDDPEIDPIPLTPDDLARYSLDLEAFARRVQQASGLSGKPASVTDHLYFLGEAESPGEMVAYILALLNDSKGVDDIVLALPKLLSGRYQHFLVACPSHSLPPAFSRRLEDTGILATLVPKNFVIPPYQVLSRRPISSGSGFVVSERFVVWRGITYRATRSQLAVVKILHEAHQRSEPFLSWGTIQQRLIPFNLYPAKMSDVIRQSGLRKLVVRTGKDLYHLDY